MDHKKLRKMNLKMNFKLVIIAIMTMVIASCGTTKPATIPPPAAPMAQTDPGCEYGSSFEEHECALIQMVEEAAETMKKFSSQVGADNDIIDNLKQSAKKEVRKYISNGARPIYQYGLDHIEANRDKLVLPKIAIDIDYFNRKDHPIEFCLNRRLMSIVNGAANNAMKSLKTTKSEDNTNEVFDEFDDNTVTGKQAIFTQELDTELMNGFGIALDSFFQTRLDWFGYEKEYTEDEVCQKICGCEDVTDKGRSSSSGSSTRSSINKGSSSSKTSSSKTSTKNTSNGSTSSKPSETASTINTVKATSALAKNTVKGLKEAKAYALEAIKAGEPAKEPNRVLMEYYIWLGDYYTNEVVNGEKAAKAKKEAEEYKKRYEKS